MDIRIQCLREDAAEPRKIASFWEAALGWGRAWEEDNEVCLQPAKGSPEDDVAPDILILKVAEGKCPEGKCPEGKCPEGKCTVSRTAVRR